MLNDVVSFLENSGFNAHLQQKTEEISCPQIWLNIGDHVMQIRDANYKIPSDDTPVSGSEIHFLNFFITFSHKIASTSFSDGARLASLLNKISPIPGYNLSEPDNSIVFHYTYPVSKLEPKSLDAILHLILYSTELCEPIIQELSENNKSFEDLIKTTNGPV